MPPHVCTDAMHRVSTANAYQKYDRFYFNALTLGKNLVFLQSQHIVYTFGTAYRQTDLQAKRTESGSLPGDCFYLFLSTPYACISNNGAYLFTEIKNIL
jgi:hypothetical protein